MAAQAAASGESNRTAFECARGETRTVAVRVPHGFPAARQQRRDPRSCWTDATRKGAETHTDRQRGRNEKLKKERKRKEKSAKDAGAPWPCDGGGHWRASCATTMEDGSIIEHGAARCCLADALAAVRRGYLEKCTRSRAFSVGVFDRSQPSSKSLLSLLASRGLGESPRFCNM